MTTKFQTLKTRLEGAQQRLDALGRVPSPSTDPESYRAYRTAESAATQIVREAQHALHCLTPVDASADELEQAAVLLGCDLAAKYPVDIVFWARGARALERSKWSIGQRVRIKPPLRMGENPGDPMVEYFDAVTGREGCITGMTPDGLNVYLDCLAPDYDDVYVGRIEAVQ